MNKKQKGRKLVLQIVKRLRNELDISAYEVAGSGAGLDKGDIRIPILDLVIEAKNSQTISMAKWTEQSEREGLGHSKTALMWRHPKSPLERPEIRVDISLDYFIDLAQRYKEPKIKAPTREVSWKIKHSIQSLKTLLKELEN